MARPVIRCKPQRRFRRAMALGASALVIACAGNRSTIPERISDAQFWELVNSLSEEGGYFHSDNFVSNELAFQYVLPELEAAVGTDAYLGVGPDQNFTYVVALRPRIAFIVDIRRQNMLQHLMYKALIEMSRDRGEFLARLFSRAAIRPAPDGASAEDLFAWLAPFPRDTVLFRENLSGVLGNLVGRGFALSSQDTASLEFIYRNFFDAGPALAYTSNAARGFWGRSMPTYRTLMTATDERGVNRGYLGSEKNFGVLKDLQERNLIVPVVGDFAGPKALRSVGEWLRAQKSEIGVFYVSNVEQYLFQQQGASEAFYTTVSGLPLAADARFIRSIPGRRQRRQHPFARSESRTSSVADVIARFNAGELWSYSDVIDLSR